LLFAARAGVMLRAGSEAGLLWGLRRGGLRLPVAAVRPGTIGAAFLVIGGLGLVGLPLTIRNYRSVYD
jgi:hypothetical protein